MKINSFDPLFEYPEYNQTGTQAKATAAAKSVTAPGKKPSQAPSASPTTTGNKISDPEPKQPTIAKASELKKDFEFPDEKGNVLKVISPVGQRTDLPNDMEDVVIAQDARKNIRVFGADAEIALPQVEVEESKLDDIIDPKKKSFAKKLMRKQNKLKQLIRAAKFDAQDAAGGVLYEINFNNANVIKAALDAPIQCGFEAETVWNEVGGGSDFDLDGANWDKVQDAIYDVEGRGAIDDILAEFNEWALESDEFWEIESAAIQDEVKEREEDEYYINEFADAELFRDDIEDYKEEKMAELRKMAKQGDMFSDNDEEGDLDADEEYAERQDWDYDAWAREFVEEEHFDDFRDWLAEQIRENGDAWDTAWEQFYNRYDMDYYVDNRYGGDWGELLTNHSIYGLAGSSSDLDLEEIASELENWTMDNSYTNDIRTGSYHSGSGTDNKYWRVEEDSSISGDGAGAEIISPVYQTPREMLQEMNSLFKFMQANNIETNNSTGFHVTMSMGAGEDQKPNQLKLAVLLNDNYIAKQFNRQNNTYTTSQLTRIKKQLLKALDGDDQSLSALEQSLGGAISQDKFNSINFKGIDNELGNQMVEFRIAGGNDYVSKFPEVSKAAIKYAVTLQAAHDPDAYRQDYLKALYKMISQAESGKLKTSGEDGGNVDIPDTPGAAGLKMLVNQIPSTQQRLDYFHRIATMYQHKGDMQTFNYYSEYMISQIVKPLINQGLQPESLKFSPSLARGMRAALKDFGHTPQSYMDWAMGRSGMTWVVDRDKNDRWTLAIVRGLLAMPKLTPTGYTPPEQKEESMDFDSLSLEEQLQFISKLDKAKIDEAWSKKYKDSINCSDPKGFSQKAHCAGKKKKKESVEEADQVKAKERKPKIVKPNKGHQSKHPYRGRLVGEGAVPETEISDEFAQLMSKPLLGSDIKGQMYAYQIVPDPAMIKEFRNMIASGGKDVDLRPIFKSFASARLHPAQKKTVGLAESVLMEKGLSLADIGKRNNFDVFKRKVASSQPFSATDGAEVVIAPTLARKIKTVDDLKQYVQKRQVMLPLKNEPGYVVPLSYLLKTAEFGGTAQKETGVANRGELAEGVLGAATFARIAQRPGKPITYNQVLKVIQSLPKTETGGTISRKVKGKDTVTDQIKLTVRLGANTYADLIDTNKLTSDELMNSYIKSTVRFVNDYTRLYANFFEQNGRPDEVEIVSDGVSENTDRKTDVYMVYVDEAGNRQLKHFDISLKAGTVRQFGQVGYGRASSPIETRFAKVMELFTQFGIDQTSFKFNPKQFQDDGGVALIKDLYKQAVRLINQKLKGSDNATEYQYLDQIAQGITYYATSNDPTVKLLQLDKGRYYVLDFKKLRPKLDGIDLEAQYAETKSGDPIVRIHDKTNPKSSGRLLQIRTKQDSNGYIRQILEKEPLLKKLISVRHVGDIER